MALERILPSLYRIRLEAVRAVNLNSFIVDSGDNGLILIDTGTPADAEQILDAVTELGRKPADVRHTLPRGPRGWVGQDQECNRRPRVHAPYRPTTLS